MVRLQNVFCDGLSKALGSQGKIFGFRVISHCLRISSPVIFSSSSIGLLLSLLGCTHRPVADRKDKGTKRPQSKGKTLSQWSRRHRDSLDCAVAGRGARRLGDVQRRAAAKVGGTFDERMSGELERQAAVRLDSFLHSLTEGSLLDSEFKANDLDLARNRLEHLAHNRSKRKREAGTKESMIRKKQRTEKSLPCGISLYFEPDAMDVDMRAAADRIAVAKLMPVVADSVDAGLLVCKSPGSMRDVTYWSVALNGGIVVDASYLCSDGAKGSAVAYKACVARGGQRGGRARLIWMSARFQRTHPELARVVTRSVSKPYSTWRLATQQQFAAEVEADGQRPVKQRRPMQQIGLVCRGEDAPPNWLVKEGGGGRGGPPPPPPPRHPGPHKIPGITSHGCLPHLLLHLPPIPHLPPTPPPHPPPQE